MFPRLQTTLLRRSYPLWKNNAIKNYINISTVLFVSKAQDNTTQSTLELVHLENNIDKNYINKSPFYSISGSQDYITNTK